MWRTSFRTAKPPYTQDDFAEQIGALAHLTKLRDAAIQKATVYAAKGGSDKKQQIYLEEGDRYDDAISTAQQVLQYMLEEVQAYTEKHR